jgi:multidrug efflux pump subunit AcrA (membrane-fusion protein)
MFNPRRIPRNHWLVILMASIPLLASAQEAALVRVMVPEAARFGERFSLTGTLTAERAAALSPRVDGLVAAVLVDAGDVVKQGQPLLELDASMAEHALGRARANTAEAAARVEEARRVFAEASRVGDAVPATLVATREA